MSDKYDSHDAALERDLDDEAADAELREEDLEGDDADRG